MLNRTAIILRYQEPFVRWINEADPVVEERSIDIEPDECTVYLIHEIENREDLDAWLAQHYQILFEEELSGWYTDESLWPTDRSLALFHEWIHVEYHTTVVDAVDGPLVDDDL